MKAVSNKIRSDIRHDGPTCTLDPTERHLPNLLFFSPKKSKEKTDLKKPTPYKAFKAFVKERLAKDPNFKVDFERADLHRAKLNKINFAGVNFAKANLQYASLSLSKLDLANFSGANLWAAKLNGASLQRANFDRADLGSASLEKADLRSASMRSTLGYNIKLKEADLRKVDLREANLHSAHLEGARLDGANLQKCILHGAQTSKASFQKVDFQEADLECANLALADLTGASFRGAKLGHNQLDENLDFLLEQLLLEALKARTLHPAEQKELQTLLVQTMKVLSHIKNRYSFETLQNFFKNTLLNQTEAQRPVKIHDLHQKLANEFSYDAADKSLMIRPAYIHHIHCFLDKIMHCQVLPLLVRAQEPESQTNFKVTNLVNATLEYLLQNQNWSLVSLLGLVDRFQRESRIKINNIVPFDSAMPKDKWLSITNNKIWHDSVSGQNIEVLTSKEELRAEGHRKDPETLMHCIGEENFQHGKLAASYSLFILGLRSLPGKGLGPNKNLQATAEIKVSLTPFEGGTMITSKNNPKTKIYYEIIAMKGYRDCKVSSKERKIVDRFLQKHLVTDLNPDFVEMMELAKKKQEETKKHPDIPFNPEGAEGLETLKKIYDLFAHFHPERINGKNNHYNKKVSICDPNKTLEEFWQPLIAKILTPRL